MFIHPVKKNAANNPVNSAGLPASPIREVTPGSGGPVCGDGGCDPGEDYCNGAADCGDPPATETDYCTDGDDNDRDGYIDCDDPDCVGDPACPEYLPKGAVCTENTDCCSSRCLPAGKCAISVMRIDPYHCVKIVKGHESVHSVINNGA